MTSPVERSVVLSEMDLYVTLDCNLQCDFCSVRANEGNIRTLPLSRTLKILEEAAELGLEELHFTGGEPTLNRDLELLIAKGKELGLHTRINTNGFHLSKARLKQLKQAGLCGVVISLDGLAERHNRHRRHPFAFEQAYQAIADSIAVGLWTRVSMTLFRENCRDAGPVLVEMESLGVDGFSFFLGSPLGRARDQRAESVLTAEEWRVTRDEIREVVGGRIRRMKVAYEQGYLYAGEDTVDGGSLRGRGGGCLHIGDNLDYLIMWPDGKLYQCCFFLDGGPSVGDASKQSLREALIEGLANPARRALAEPADRCAGCADLPCCELGCPGFSYLLLGDWRRTDPRCPHVRDEEPHWWPLCPIRKVNARSGYVAGSCDDVFAQEISPPAGTS